MKLDWMRLAFQTIDKFAHGSLQLQLTSWGNGQQSTKVSILASGASCPGLNTRHSLKNSEEKSVNVAEESLKMLIEPIKYWLVASKVLQKTPNVRIKLRTIISKMFCYSLECQVLQKVKSVKISKLLFRFKRNFCEVQKSWQMTFFKHSGSSLLNLAGKYKMTTTAMTTTTKLMTTTATTTTTTMMMTTTTMTTTKPTATKFFVKFFCINAKRSGTF